MHIYCALFIKPAHQ